MIDINEVIKDLEQRYYRINCDNCDNNYYGSREQYNREMSNRDNEWTCGHCGNRDSSNFDDEYWEEMQEKIWLHERIKELENRVKELENE